ncbi:MAG: von Willebrand factor type A domain-containing protein [Vicinamibacteraceae bacterium]
MGARLTTAKAAVVLLVCVGLWVARPFAAQDRAALSGTVTDPSGAALPGATVTVKGPRPPDVTVVTNEHGIFRVLVLPPGTYAVRVELSGFVVEEVPVTVVSDRPTTLAVVLRIGNLSDTVTVSSEAVQIQASSSSRAYAVTASQPMNLRRGRLLDTTAGGFDREGYRHLPETGFHRVGAHPRSTFSTDVDTASYTNVRRMLQEGQLPPEGAVRIEEFVNYFRFDYAPPAGDTPVAISTEVGPCPWNEDHLLALVGVRAADVPPRDGVRGRNLVFLVDVSGSMSSDDKLPLVRRSLHLLTDRLGAADRIAMVVYAGSSGLALPSTSGKDKAAIHAAIDRLASGGSTNGGEGIRLAYRLAREQFVAGGVNRVILATDGDFNVGVTSEDQLVRLIEKERQSGVFLTVLGVGGGNLQDSTMEALADKGNGHYAYLDSIDEARKVLVREMDATLVTVAKDVKIQVEFNPRQVAAYRLIGYENRRLDDEDFNDDAKDAGEMGAGHTVTALYEIVPAGRPVPGRSVDPLKYQRRVAVADARRDGELMTVALRYKRPAGGRSERIQTVVKADAGSHGPNLGFASAVAELGLLLTRSAHAGTADADRLIERARAFTGEDPYEDRAGFVTLAERAAELLREARLARR